MREKTTALVFAHAHIAREFLLGFVPAAKAEALLVRKLDRFARRPWRLAG